MYTLYTAAAALAILSHVSATSEATLNDICKVEYAQSALPEGVIQGVTVHPSSVSTEIVYNTTYTSIFYPTAAINYCNLTFAYSHNGMGDEVHVSYWLPTPSAFSNRYVSTGGGGFAINEGPGFAPTGIIVGAVSGITDGGFGSLDTTWDEVFLLANGTINWPSVYMMGYQAHNELVILGKQLTRNLYNVTDEAKVYSYYQGCSEGGREGWSQVQRSSEFDGVAVGAPALRYGQQQANHMYENLVELQYNYTMTACELNSIVEIIIETCDPLDGWQDGIVSRSDLCLIHLDLASLVGRTYSCPASYNTGVNGAAQVGWAPAINGTFTAEAIQVAQGWLRGLHNSLGERAYFTYQPGAGFGDIQISYNNETQTYTTALSTLGSEWIARYLFLEDTDFLSRAYFDNNATADMIVDWMAMGMNRYYDNLQTTYPDLSHFRDAGSKVLHFHGEQDSSIPTASSVRYWDSVRQIMYPDMSYKQSTDALDDFYRLFLIPGAAHCSLNDFQPDGPWPQTTLQTLIQWVEEGVAPATLDGTGAIDTICRYPLRPLWSGNGSNLECVYSQESIDHFTYTLDAFAVPVY